MTPGHDYRLQSQQASANLADGVFSAAQAKCGGPKHTARTITWTLPLNRSGVRQNKTLK